MELSSELFRVTVSQPIILLFCLDSFSEEKPIVKIGEFDIKDPVNDIANGIVQIGTICLDFIVNNPVFSTFRIEIVPIDDQKNYMGLFLTSGANLMLGTITFLRCLPTNPKKNLSHQTLIVLAMLNVYFHHKLTPRPTLRKQILEINKDEAANVSPLRYHPFGVYQPRIFCAKTVPQKLLNDRFCNWYVEDERIVLEKDGWIAISQPENVREILVCPHPGKGYEGLPIPEGVRPINHKNNKELAVDLDFWTWIFETFVSSYLVGEICENTEHTPVELFALNFGSWEALETRNKQAKECLATYMYISHVLR
ncbi:unnamed protein product [Rhizophagus irregularis]|nr:unnamed protein product [Rhizophagus irregularis]